MKYSTFALAAAAGSAAAQQSAYGQCGGGNWTGETTCVSGYTCTSQNDWYYQCVAGSATTAIASSTAPAAQLTTSAKPTTSVKPVTSKATTSKAVTSTMTTKVLTSAQSSSSALSGYVTSARSSSSSLSGYVTSAASSSITSAVVTSKVSSTSATTRASTSATPTSTASSTGKVKYAGVNIAGLDFGCSTDGTCSSGGYSDPGTTGQDQMKHFVNDDGLNAFRIPVGWQYLVGNTLGATLDSDFFKIFDAQVQYCLDSAELCIVDLHNYARWNGDLIGSGSGPTATQFASVWSQLATKYASSSKVAFGLMNEPHDLTSVSDWATTIQTVVTAIRKAGATDNMILLPGNDWTHASTLVSDGSAAALAEVTNLDGSTTNLIFDVHQYSDSDGSGTSTTCTTDNTDAFSTLATWLRSNNRQAFLSEAGGSSDSSCITDVCAELSYLMKNSDVYLGWTGWAAGAFATSYALSETPSGSAGSYTDTEVLTKCIAGVFSSA